MKYILLMSSTKAGVSEYLNWSQKDRDTHMQALGKLAGDLTQTGEFVDTQGLRGADEAKVVRGEKNGLPVTDGVFPETKEFLLGYWIVDVALPSERMPSPARSPRRPGREASRPTWRSRCGSLPAEVRKFAWIILHERARFL